MTAVAKVSSNGPMNVANDTQTRSSRAYVAQTSNFPIHVPTNSGSQIADQVNFSMTPFANGSIG